MEEPLMTRLHDYFMDLYLHIFLSPNKTLHGDILSPNKILDGDILSPNKIYQGDILSPNRGRH